MSDLARYKYHDQLIVVKLSLSLMVDLSQLVTIVQD